MSHQRTTSLSRHALIVALALAVARVLGLLRETLIAARFGASADLDAYLAAFRLPDLLFAVLMSGTFGAAFIPVFSGLLERGDEARAEALASTLMTWTVVLLGGVAALVIAFADPLIGVVVAPDLPAATHDQAVDLTRWLLFSPLLLGIGAATRGMLEAHETFAITAIAPILYNLGIIGGVVVFAPLVGIDGLVIGVVLGALAGAALQGIAVARRGIRLRPRLTTGDDVRAVTRLLGPRLASGAVGQGNLIALTNIASGLETGSIAILTYAQHLVLLPHGILALSVSTVIFPRLSRLAETARHEAVRDVAQRSFAMLTALTLPAALLLATFRVSIVQVVLAWGEFSTGAIGRTADAVGILSIGLLARVLIEPLTRGFFALRDTRTPLITSTVGLVTTIVLGSALAGAFGLRGLAWAAVIASIVRLVMMLALFDRRVPGIATGTARAAMRMLPALAVATLIALAIAPSLARATDPDADRSLLDGVWLVTAMALVTGTYLATALLSGVPEITQLRARLTAALTSLMSRWR